MNKYLSDKLRIISLLLMILVVFLHSYNLTVRFNTADINFEGRYNFFIQNFFGKGITYVAVPFFFLISGYLFFLKFNGTMAEFAQKYRKRAKTLFLPYLAWSAWGLFFYFALQQIPQSKNFFTHELIADYSISKFLDTLFIHPIPYQLWFIRDLMILVLISPLIYGAIKYLRALFIVILFTLWLGFLNFEFSILYNISIFYFSLGAYFAIYKKDVLLKKRTENKYWIVTFLWILTVLLKTVLLQLNNDQFLLLSLVDKLSVMLGIVAIWSMYDYIMSDKEKPNKKIYYISLFSFFIFASHEPILTIVKKGIFSISGASETMSIINYFLAPIITIIISILLGVFLKKYASKFYGLITGSR
jgi:surface polysaccharide O-acyltransferase-like enzyme